jgi:hypothetical protein
MEVKGSQQRKGCRREAGSKGSVEQTCEPMNKNRIKGAAAGRAGYLSRSPYPSRTANVIPTRDELAPFMRGWRGYFGFCETPQVLVELTRWVRMRLGVALWRQWKTPRRRRAALLALGVSAPLATNTAASGYGPWRLIRTRGPSAGLSNAYFRSLGLPSLFEAC